ncbi:DUF1592 domain-containing protein [Brevifollis gellanilyticus]|uniref:Cytochrome c n=1 Tax=Brevifollis gellanilyticus TaxID=748831 RepID=A0A512M4Y5_9BACT|nr:DUF1592 domain-containing protein [Brevifollis gellanilyticus]GEP41789.1 hypothetical protein BGE01nite_10800 [Brevifollis gellanilyticus]
MFVRFAASVFCLLSASAWAAPGSFADKLKPLLETHCLECHGEDVQKGKLQLDQEVSFSTWTKVHDRMAAGEMPPKKSDQPPQAMKDEALKLLSDSLHAASLEKQRTQGRTALRRLNGTEYENTVRDLIGTRVKLKEVLPEENSAGGFDNVSAVLDLSSTHLLLYQEAAEKAVNSAIPIHPHLPVSDRRTGRQIADTGNNFKQTLTRSCYIKGDALVVYSKLPRYGLVCTPHVNGAGRYRVRMSASAVGEANVPVPVSYCTVDRGREPPVVRDMVDLPPGAPRVIETEIELDAGEAFVLQLQLNWDIRATKQPIERYKGPGFLIEWLEIEGPINEFPTPAYRTLFGNAELMPKSVVKARAEGKRTQDWSKRNNIYQWLNDPLEPVSAAPKEDADKLLRAFIPRAFRGPVDEATLTHFISKVHTKLDAGESFVNAMIFGYKSVLTSPQFLFFQEAPGVLERHALANRLAYFLTSLPPDAELLAADVTKPEVLHQQTERLLKSPRGRGFTENFTGQWLELRKMDATIPDPNLYGDFDGTLLWAMPEETRRFFDDVLQNDRSVLEFVDSSWTLVNRRLADHYRIAEAFEAAKPPLAATDSKSSSVPQSEFRRVSLPLGSHRGGVMTHGSVLKVTADGTTTSPVLRGKWVLEHMLGTGTPPPPPDVPAIEPDIRGATTIRQQLDKHRHIAACNSCHQHIDPPGFALETFDPIGGYRDFYRVSVRPAKPSTVSIPGYSGRAIYRGPDVEMGGVTHDGRTFTSIEDYKRILLENPDQIARNLAERLLTYATGAEPQFADREVIEQVVSTVKTKNYGLRTLVHEIVQSRPFRNK